MDGIVEVYALGLMAASACAPAGMTAEEVAAEVNRQYPTGIESPWSPDPAPAFRQGGPNPGPCEKDPERQHWLFQC